MMAHSTSVRESRLGLGVGFFASCHEGLRCYGRRMYSTFVELSICPAGFFSEPQSLHARTTGHQPPATNQLPALTHLPGSVRLVADRIGLPGVHWSANHVVRDLGVGHLSRGSGRGRTGRRFRAHPHAGPPGCSARRFGRLRVAAGGRHAAVRRRPAWASSPRSPIPMNLPPAIVTNRRPLTAMSRPRPTATKGPLPPVAAANRWKRSPLSRASACARRS